MPAMHYRLMLLLAVLLLTTACKKRLYTAQLEDEAYAWIAVPPTPFRYVNQYGDTLVVTEVEEETGAFDIEVPPGADARRATAERLTRSFDLGNNYRVEMVLFAEAPAVDERTNQFYYDFTRLTPNGFTSTGGEAWPDATLFDTRLDTFSRYGHTYLDVYFHEYTFAELDLYYAKGHGLVGFRSQDQVFIRIQ